MGENGIRQILLNAYSQGRKFLLEPEAKRICEILGLPVSRWIVAKSQEEAIEAAEKLGYPVVLKVVSPDILHKSDVGGVILNLGSPSQVKEAYNQLINNVKNRKPDARIEGVLVEQMAEKNIEVIVGGIRDPQFGPVVMFGLGGIFVEILKDVSFRITPVTLEDAYQMIKEVRGYPILAGARGQKPLDIEILAQTIVKVSDLFERYGEIDQLDLNPIFVYERGARIVDARILLTPRGEGA